MIALLRDLALLFFFGFVMPLAAGVAVIAVLCLVYLLAKRLWGIGGAGVDLLRGGPTQRELDRIIHERNQAILGIVRLHDEGMRQIDQMVARRQITSRPGRQS
jgi:hypothetical protein